MMEELQIWKVSLNVLKLMLRQKIDLTKKMSWQPNTCQQDTKIWREHFNNKMSLKFSKLKQTQLNKWWHIHCIKSCNFKFYALSLVCISQCKSVLTLYIVIMMCGCLTSCYQIHQGKDNNMLIRLLFIMRLLL